MKFRVLRSGGFLDTYEIGRGSHRVQTERVGTGFELEHPLEVAVCEIEVGLADAAEAKRARTRVDHAVTEATAAVGDAILDDEARKDK
jgi:hypothetical protein